MKQTKRKKKRTGPSRSANDVGNGCSESKEQKVVNGLVEAFSSASVEETKLVYDQAGGYADKDAEILAIEVPMLS